MPTLTVNTVRSQGVTFVEVLVEADQRYRVRIEHRLESAVWPPRVDGQPINGWDREGVTASVASGTTALGFATRAPPNSEPVVELTTAEPLEANPLPEGIDAWLQRVEQRVTRAEALADVEDLPEATAAIESVGGLAGAEALVATLKQDRHIASRLAFVPADLEARLDAVDVPLQSFTRLAQSRRS